MEGQYIYQHAHGDDDAKIDSVVERQGTGGRQDWRETVETGWNLGSRACARRGGGAGGEAE